MGLKHVYWDSRGFTIEVNDKQSEGSKILGIFFNFFGQIIDQFNTSCRRYGNLEGIRVSRFLEGLVGPESKKGLKSSRFWELGGSTRSNFEKKGERKYGK